MGKIVITGASSEIGLSITGKLAGLGKPMVLHCFKNSDTLERWRGVAEIVKADFSQREELDMFIAGLDDVEILVYASAVTDSIAAGSLKRLNSFGMEEIKQVNSLNRLGSPEDVAEVVHFLCTPASSFITGTVIEVSGGHLMGV